MTEAQKEVLKELNRRYEVLSDYAAIAATLWQKERVKATLEAIAILKDAWKF